MSVRLRDCLGVLDALYPPSWAESWDAVGLVTGDPADAVDRVLFAVDPTERVAEQAVRDGVQLLVCHHPLFLRGVHGVPATAPGGRVVRRLLSAGVALVTAHTNADVALPGVSDALAAAVGLDGLDVLAPAEEQLDKLVAYVPVADTPGVLDALAAAGAGRIGDYERCAWWVEGTGTFLPGAGAVPAVGAVGRVERVAEDRLEMVVPRDRRAAVVRALRAAHPYEEPAFDVLPMALPARHGLGRVGELPAAMSLAELTGRVGAALPATAAGVRAAGGADRPVRRVAVCGGAGDSLVGDALRAGADVLVTADWRHHRALDAVAAGLAVVDVAHWASEWPWLADAAQRLSAGLGGAVTTSVSRLVTDPWCVAVPGTGRSDAGP